MSRVHIPSVLLNPPDLPRLPTLFTARGLALAAIVLFLLIGPVSKENDVFAAVVAYSLLALLVVVFLVCAIIGSGIRRTMQVEVVPESNSSDSSTHHIKTYAKKITRFIIRSAPIRIPPFFSLSLRLDFGDERPPTIIHRLTGSTKRARALAEDIAFPHRGMWTPQSLEVVFGDSLGMTKMRWEIHNDSIRRTFKIFPNQMNRVHLPILSSCNRAGDTLSDVQERRGDPYDIKPYHHSDGMRKIVWKIYAKSGELFSRHPEPSMTPEGQVLVFTLAARSDDHVCSATTSYLEKLEEENLEIFFGCEGMSNRGIVHGADEAENLLIDSVWETPFSGPSESIVDLEKFLSSSREIIRDGRIDRIILFGSIKRLSSQAAIDWFILCGRLVESLGAKPTYFLVEGTTLEKSTARKPSLIHRILYRATKKRDSNEYRNYSAKFMDICLTSDWQVILGK